MLDNLPEEVQSQIIQTLDPISLVFLSHVNHHFRNLIQPTAQRFLEYLFALECLPAYGGPELQFCARNNVQTPQWDEDAARKMRWACPCCKRLLNHWHFSNHSLLGLPYRKPPYESSAALPVTTWKPTRREDDKFWRKSRKTLNQQHTDLKRLRQQYHIAVTRLWGRRVETLIDQERWSLLQDAGMEPYFSKPSTEMSNEELFQVFDGVIRSLEDEICGYNRHQRRCNECRYQLGQLRLPRLASWNQRGHRGPNIGTNNVPILKSRQFFIKSPFQRYFPGLFTNMPSYTPLVNERPISKVYRAHATNELFSMYSIRCPRCKIWKEMAFFGIGNVWVKWSPGRARRGSRWDCAVNWDGEILTDQVIDDLTCSKCYYHQHGPKALDDWIQRWCRKLLGKESAAAERDLRRGWGCLEAMANRREAAPRGFNVRDTYRDTVRKEIFSGFSWTTDDTSLQRMSEKLGLLKANWDTWCYGSRGPPLPPFLLHFEALVAEYRWLRNALDETYRRPSALREWVLGPASEQGYYYTQ